MTTSTLVAPISLSNDLLTGAEWSPAHTRELLQLSADNRPDAAIATRGAYSADGRVTVFEGSRGSFAPGEVRTYILRGASQRVRALRGGRVRLAAGAEG